MESWLGALRRSLFGAVLLVGPPGTEATGEATGTGGAEGKAEAEREGRKRQGPGANLVRLNLKAESIARHSQTAQAQRPRARIGGNERGEEGREGKGREGKDGWSGWKDSDRPTTRTTTRIQPTLAR